MSDRDSKGPADSEGRAPVQNLGLLFVAAGLALVMVLATIALVAYFALG